MKADIYIIMGFTNKQSQPFNSVALSSCNRDREDCSFQSRPAQVPNQVPEYGETMQRHTSVYDATVIRFPRIEDPRGNLTYVEQQTHIPFDIQRVYWIYDVPGGKRRGKHAFHTQQECIIALSGSLDVLLDDGHNQKIVTLNHADTGLYVPPMLWRCMQGFSTNAVAYVLASGPYDETDYIRDYDTYLECKGLA